MVERSAEMYLSNNIIGINRRHLLYFFIIFRKLPRERRHCFFLKCMEHSTSRISFSFY